MESFLAIQVWQTVVRSRSSLASMSAFGLAEHQAVDPKNVHRRVQELERMAFGAIAPPCHVYPDLGLYRTTGLPLCQKLMTDPRTSAQ